MLGYTNAWQNDFTNRKYLCLGNGRRIFAGRQRGILLSLEWGIIGVVGNNFSFAILYILVLEQKCMSGMGMDAYG